MSKIQTVKPRIKALSTVNARPMQTTKRPTGNSLYALMKSFSINHPRVCAECVRQGTVSYGEELDHIVPLHLGGSNSVHNLQWLCYSHHLEKSQAEEYNRNQGEWHGGSVKKSKKDD